MLKYTVGFKKIVLMQDTDHRFFTIYFCEQYWYGIKEKQREKFVADI